MDCVICLERIDIYSYVSILPCGHLYHPMCYNNWSRSFCPICRFPNLNKKIDTIMINQKCLYQWTNDDFKHYAKFIERNPELVKCKKIELMEQISRKKTDHIKHSISTFYKRKGDEIRYNILKGISNNKKKFIVLSVPFGDTYEGYPSIFLLKGPKDEKDYFTNRGITSFMDILKINFDIMSFSISSNNSNLCYEVKAIMK